MLNNLEQALINKIKSRIEEEANALRENLSEDTLSSFDRMRINQGIIIGIERVRRELIPDVVTEIIESRK